MVSPEDRSQLERAAQLLRDVISRHRGDDLRAITLLTEAIQDIRVPERLRPAYVAPLDIRSART